MKLKPLIEQVKNADFGVISEASLSRLLSKAKNNDFCILTAFRGEYDLKQNKKRNGELLTLLNSKQMGGYMLIGHWQEAPEDMDYKDASPDQLTDTTEDSILFVKPAEMSREDFISFCTGIGKRYNQDAVIVGLVGDGIYLYYKNGGSDKIGTDITLNKTAQAYSQMRKKKNVPFVFEGSLQPTNNISKQSFKQKNIRYVI